MAGENDLIPPNFQTHHRHYAQLQYRRAAVNLPQASVYPVSHAKDVDFTLTLAQSLRASSLVLAGDIDEGQPLTWARAPDGTVYFANGLGPVLKFDGVYPEARQAGVPPPTLTPALAISGSGTITGAYTCFVRYLDADGRPSNLSPLSNTVTASNNLTVTYSNIQAPSDPKIVRRQILRNSAGQTVDYFVDVDTTDLTTTSFTSTRTDTQLQARERVPLFTTVRRGQGINVVVSLADRFTVPRSDKPIITTYLDRLFLAGEVTYSKGSVQVTIGSTTVTGIGTAWPTQFGNSDTDLARYLYIVGHDQFYQILSVDKVNQTLTLATAYQGSTDLFALYSIRSSPSSRRSFYYTEAGYYEAWPELNAWTIEENGDEVTAVLPLDSFLFFAQRRHLFRFTFGKSPDIDGGLFPAARRGCVNQNCWIALDDAAYLLDEQGVYRFVGADQAEQLSEPVQDLWYADSPRSGYRINWKHRKHFHAAHFRDENTIRFFVCMDGGRLPRHALYYNYATQEFGIEEYPFSIGASTLAGGDVPVSILAGSARRVFTMGPGNLDGPDAASGTTRGTATAAGVLSVTDAVASFAGSGLVGFPVSIWHGKGKGQTRLVSAVVSGKITVVKPFLVQPDTTSRYQLGGIPWKWLSKKFRWLRRDGNQERYVELQFDPAENSQQMDVKLYRDRNSSPDLFAQNWPPSLAERDAVEITRNDAEARVDLSHTSGFAQIAVSGSLESRRSRADLVTVEFVGYSGLAAISLSQLIVEGAQ